MTRIPSELTMLDLAGRAARVLDLVGDRPVMLAFLRHFG
jgi:hypothetical protein